MIPFNFIYCRPNTLKEAYESFCQFQREGKAPLYYAGGSEIITMCRGGSIKPGAVIDIKNIPECNMLCKDQEGLHLGSTCTLTKIKESNPFPLLSLCCGRIADHTNQCRITLGGNLCGSILYRETSLPLLSSNAMITFWGDKGLREQAFSSLFQGRMHLNPGELIVKITVPTWALNAPYFHVKQTQNEKIDYPLVSMAAILHNKELRIAFSGICSAPFRSTQMEAALNDSSLDYSSRAEKAVKRLPEPAHHDVEGSSEYRRFVLKNMLVSLMEEIEHD